LITRKDQTKGDLASFLLAACFSPVCSTLLAAIKNNHLTTWPGMEHKFMKQHISDVILSDKGHLNQDRQGLQPTKETPVTIFQTYQDTLIKT